MTPIESYTASKPISVGDQDDLARRFELFRPYLLAMARRQILPSAVVDDSESDLVQETYVAAHQQWTNFRGSAPEELLSWLRVILRRQISRWRRQSKKSPASDSSPAMSRIIASEIVDARASPDQQLEQDEDYQRLLGLVQKMPDMQRQIIEGRIEQDETFQVIGARLGISEDAARMAFHRAINKIRGDYEVSTILCLRASREGEKPCARP